MSIQFTSLAAPCGLPVAVDASENKNSSPQVCSSCGVNRVDLSIVLRSDYAKVRIRREDLVQGVAN